MDMAVLMLSWRKFDLDCFRSCDLTWIYETVARAEIGRRAQRTKRTKIRRATMVRKDLSSSFKAHSLIFQRSS
jgi:hypothetical protein